VGGGGGEKDAKEEEGWSEHGWDLIEDPSFLTSFWMT